MRTPALIATAFALVLASCGSSGDQGGAAMDRQPQPAPQVTLTPAEKEVWAPLPPDRTQIPVLLYHGIGAESDFSNPDDAAYGVTAENFAKQMTLMHSAGYRTITLAEFVRFVQGKQVNLPAHPLLLTFDDARLDSWTGSDEILRKLGFQAVMFVDVGRVNARDPEYMTWDELRTAQSSGRWDLQVHAGRGHTYVRYGLGQGDTGPAYAYEKLGESFDRWRERVFSDIRWGKQQLAANTPGYRPLAFAPPFGSYGQDGTNDSKIPDALLSWLTQQFNVVFTQDRSAFARPGDENPLGRIDVTRSVTGGALHAELTQGAG